jgi:hypothetical protein
MSILHLLLFFCVLFSFGSSNAQIQNEIESQKSYQKLSANSQSIESKGAVISVNDPAQPPSPASSSSSDPMKLNSPSSLDQSSSSFSSSLIFHFATEFSFDASETLKAIEEEIVRVKQQTEATLNDPTDRPIVLEGESLAFSTSSIFELDGFYLSTLSAALQFALQAADIHIPNNLPQALKSIQTQLTEEKSKGVDINYVRLSQLTRLEWFVHLLSDSAVVNQIHQARNGNKIKVLKESNPSVKETLMHLDQLIDRKLTRQLQASSSEERFEVSKIIRKLTEIKKKLQAIGRNWVENIKNGRKIEKNVEIQVMKAFERVSNLVRHLENKELNKENGQLATVQSDEQTKLSEACNSWWYSRCPAYYSYYGNYPYYNYYNSYNYPWYMY